MKSEYWLAYVAPLVSLAIAYWFTRRKNNADAAKTEADVIRSLQEDLHRSNKNWSEDQQRMSQHWSGEFERLRQRVNEAESKSLVNEAEVARLRAEADVNKAEMARLRAENDALRAEMATLKAQQAQQAQS